MKALHGLMSEFLPEVAPQVVIKTDGQLKITTTDLTDALSNDLIATEMIKKIEMEARSYRDSPQTISFTAEKGESWRTCSIRIEAPDANKVLAFKSRFENLIRSACLWYSLFRPANYAASILLALALSGICLGVITGLLFYLRIIGYENWLAWVVSFFSNIALVTMFLVFVTKRMFPGVEFYMGLSKRAADSLTTARSVIFGAIFLGLIVSIASSFLYDAMKSR